MELTPARLKELLLYNPENGRFTWRIDRGGPAKAGTVAGNRQLKRKTWYLRIRVDDVSYPAHRLAVLFMTGHWPEKQVDHIDGNGLNNSWLNLRCASNAENGANRGIYANNSTGFKGVTFNKKSGLFKAQIMLHGKNHYLGERKTAADAAALYAAAAHKMFGEFARVDECVSP